MAHEARFVSFVWRPTEWDSCAFMGLAAPGGVRGGLPRNLLPKTARNGFADLNGSGMGSQLPLLPLLSSAVPKLRARRDMICFIWSLAHQVPPVKATEAPSLSFGDASPNDHEGASPLVICCSRRSTTLLRVATIRMIRIWLRAWPLGWRSWPHSCGEGEESASSPTAALSHSGREAARISFVWPPWRPYEGDESDFVPAARLAMLAALVR